jgi:hypothetical protein
VSPDTASARGIAPAGIAAPAARTRRGRVADMAGVVATGVPAEVGGIAAARVVAAGGTAAVAIVAARDRRRGRG